MGRVYILWCRDKLDAIRDGWKLWLLPIGVITGVYLVALSALLRANVSYLDDYGRVLWGYRGWENFSRYLSNFLSIFLHTSKTISDISPLPQMLAAVLMAAAGVVVVYVVTGKTKLTVWQYAAVIPMGLSPYFLECFSYKFDAPYMALSVLAGVLPLLVWRRGWVTYTMASVVSILVVCTTYQASSGVFPMLVVLVAMKRWHEKENAKDLLRFVGLSVLGYGVGLVIFRLFIMTPVSDYVSNGMPPLVELPGIVIGNYKTYFTWVITDFRRSWLLAVAALVVCFVYSQVRNSKQNKILAVVVAIASVVVTLLLCFGMYPLLERPLFLTRAMYGFGIWVAFLSVFVCTADRIYIGKLAALGLAWALVVFSLIYGNWMWEQEKYTEFRMQQAIDDLVESHVLEGDSAKTVQITGTIGYSPGLENRPGDAQRISRLVPVTFSASSWEWGRFEFQHYYGLEQYMIMADDVDVTGLDLPVVVDNVYHTIRADEEHILIELKG